MRIEQDHSLRLNEGESNTEKSGEKEAIASKLNRYTEPYRPQFHFSPKKNWMNDPNGLIFYRGNYHCYFQFNPDGDQWGNIQWGHAISSDGLHWEEKPVALKDAHFMAFSGTTAILPKDYPEIKGKKGDLIAAYTSFEYTEKNEELKAIAQHQSLALSSDGGNVFKPILQNPVLHIGSTEFRDPKIMYDQTSDCWLMLVAYADKHQIGFFKSADLLKWKETGRFGPSGNTEAVWECPDLFYLELEDGSFGKWILTLSAGHPTKGFLGMQYFVGDFDGEVFKEDQFQKAQYLDYGKDFYAGITFGEVQNPKSVLMMGWIGNHLYSRLTPTHPWRGSLSLPRTLRLKQAKDRLYLNTYPQMEKLKALYDGKSWSRGPFSLHSGVLNPGVKTRVCHIRLDFELKNAEEFGLQLLKDDDCQTLVGMDCSSSSLFVDRRNSSTSSIHKDFATLDHCPVQLASGINRLDILLDDSVLEVFLNGGKYAMTHLVFSAENAADVRLYAMNGEVLFHRVVIQNLKSIWKS